MAKSSAVMAPFACSQNSPFSHHLIRERAALVIFQGSFVIYHRNSSPLAVSPSLITLRRRHNHPVGCAHIPCFLYSLPHWCHWGSGNAHASRCIDKDKKILKVQKIRTLRIISTAPYRAALFESSSSSDLAHGGIKTIRTPVAIRSNDGGSPFNRGIQHEAKHSAILSRAAKLFNTKGARATTLSDVAEKLGLTKTSLYYYVKTKEDLIYQCYDAAMKQALASLDAIERRTDNPLERTLLFMRSRINTILLALKGEGDYYAAPLELAS